MKKGLEKLGVLNQPSDNLPVFTYLKGKFGCNNPNIEIEIIRYSSDFQSRNKGLIDPTILQEKKATVIGLGSGGSLISLILERSGIKTFNLIDFDTVSLGNICRSIYNLEDIGMKKTEALYKHMLKINPLAEIKLFDEDVLEMEYSKLMGIIKESDIIIECTDNTKTKIRINGLAHKTTPVLYPGVYPEGKGGDIALTLPGLPCYECIFKELIHQEEERPEWDYTNDKPKAMPGLLADIQVVAARTAKLALGILTSDQKDSFIDKIIEPGCTMLLIGNQKDFYVFDKPFMELWIDTEINPKCTCQTLK